MSVRCARIVGLGLLVWVHVGACGAARPPGSLYSPDGGFDGPPRPIVVDAFPDASGDVGDGARGTPVGAPVGATRDAGGDTKPLPPSPRDAGASADAPAGACNIFLQNCASGEGCYIGVDGVPLCLPAGELGESAPCGEQQQCAPRLLCVEVNGDGIGTCQFACDPTRTAICSSQGQCQRLAWVTVGYCAP